MRKVALFIAVSLDGYIADSHGGVSWLDGRESSDTPDAYSRFIRDVDTVVMGWNTYHQIVTELSPETWIYRDLTSYVITHRTVPSTEKIRFTRQNPCALVRRLRQENGKTIWICGGANLIHQLMDENLIDTYDISVIPTMLGDGIRLFQRTEHHIELQLLQLRRCGSIAELIYERTTVAP